MHTIKLNVGDNASKAIDMSAYKIEAFKAIKDPLKWQQKIRAEWD